ncbi:MAG: DUF1365 domain-containing protein [Nitrospirae bacterium]|nr:DUF1365 domain-containing protein [Nitrospirota bacterium]NTW65027.1 DUF1365 domain-containing protein [Nitrospirota bacterium]
MHSCIYEGEVRHARYRPKENRFRTSVFFLYLDLAELDTVFNGRWLWSTKGFDLAYLRRKDHFGDPSLTIDEAVRALVQQKTGKRPAGPVRMMTHLRYLGHNFNPATFYYCYDAAGSRVETIVVEVHNTPWGEVHCYVVDERDNMGSREQKRFRLKKDFTVSPFMPMDLEYEWNLTEPGGTVSVHMADFDKEGKIFEAKLAVERREITGASLARMLLKYPMVTVKVIAGIYWQAFRLWRKGVTFYGHA